MKKSQAATEFFMAYGWALLILILVVTGLFALGVFKSPEFKSLCNIGAPFACVDIVVQDSQSAVNNNRNPLLIGLLVAGSRRLNGTLDELKI